MVELVYSLSIPYEMSYQEIPPPADNGDAAPKESVWRSAWNNNKGACLILLAEFAGMSGDAIARYLQQGDAKFNPLQVRHSYPLRSLLTCKIVFARMGITFILSNLYMWLTNVPDFPLGPQSVRGWLLLRAVSGFAGLYCLFCELIFKLTVAVTNLY